MMTFSDRVAIFLPSLRGGGAERIMVTLANAFAERGCVVDMVLANAQGPNLNHVSDAVRIVNLGADRVINALFPLANYLRTEKPVAMLSALTHANVIALLAREIAGSSTRLVVSERGSISGEYKVAKGLVAVCSFKLARVLYPRADKICVVSRGASEDLRCFLKLPADKITTIYNPFDLKFIGCKMAELPDHPWFLANLPPVILAIGRLNESKDFALLIRAFALLRKTHFARLMILGEGELRSALEAQVAGLGFTEDDVQLPGFVSNPYAYLARCRLFVLSSQREGLPGVLIEALACGAPVVSTDCPSGPDEILEGGRWGRVVPVGDAAALAQAMAKTLDTPCGLLPDVRQRAQNFEKEPAVDAYLEILGVRAE